MVSIYIIGSVARNEDDYLSDKDLLVVGGPSRNSATVDRFVDEGWNVSRYTRAEFEAMTAAQSLFVQHVKQDGVAIRDDGGYVGSLLARSKPKKNYIGQLKSAIQPIFRLSELDEQYWNRLLQADIMFVAVRNACVFHRATYGEPEFDYDRLINWTSKCAEVSASDKEALLELRSLKHAYRNRLYDIDVSGVPAIKKAALKLAKYWNSEVCAPSVNADLSNGYFEVRELEVKLVSLFKPTFLDNLSHDHDLAELWSVICNPSLYDKPRNSNLPKWSALVSKLEG
tara:strand:- start:3706 stop:4557 length:852 start_codon:yes stop_codon:yes gene_type:complete